MRYIIPRTMKRAAIKAISSFLPSATLTNEQLAERFADLSAEQILSKTGIAVRHIAAKEECASDLGVAAAEKLFATGACAPEDVDFLLFCTQSPDYFLPTTACVMQSRLGLKTSCGAIDFNQGCSGYIYGLALAKSLVESGTSTNVLLVTSDTYTRFINPRDRSLLTLFGDGAAATLISGVEAESELIGPFILGTDGRGANNLIVKAGGLRCPASTDTAIETEDSRGNWRAENDLYMDGAELFNFAVKQVPEATNQLLARAGLSRDQIDLFILHQANRFMLERLRGKMKIPAEKFWIEMEDGGNTVSSTIPMALEAATRAGRVQAGSRVALVGFGVGYSWGAAMIRTL